MGLFLIIQIVSSVNSMSVSAEENENHEPQIMVSLGDSYSSGEGIEPFYGQDELISIKVQNEDWLAHRSQKSWAGLLVLPNNEGTMADGKDKYWFFEAASGAMTDNLKYEFVKEYDKGGYKGRYSLNPQLAVFDELEENSVDYVTITIGGNDVGFADIVKTCALGSTFLNPNGLKDKLDKIWKDFEEDGGVKDRLLDAYIDIEEAAGEQADIIVVGYPTLFDKNGKGVAISKKEACLVNDKVCQFNDAIESIVNACKSVGMNIYFVSVEEVFDGHEAYSDTPYIKPILPTQDEDIDEGFPPVSAYSMHPNEEGAKAYASCVQAKIDEIESCKEKTAVSEDMNLSGNPEATDEEKEAKEKHFSGMVVKPEDVVLKMFDALQKGEYETAAECLDPATEQQLDFWGGIASTLVAVFTGDYISWGQLVLEAAGATDVDVIECYSENLVMESNVDVFAKWIPKIPGLNNLMCTEADVIVKYRYGYEGEYYTVEEKYHVRRYEWSGWRIEEN